MSNDNLNSDDPHWDPFAYHPRRPAPPIPNAHAGPSSTNTPQLGRPIIDDGMEEVSWRMSILELDSAGPAMEAQPRQYPVVPMYTMNANGEPEIEYPEFIPMVMDEHTGATTPLYPPYVPRAPEENTQQPSILYPPGVQSWPSATSSSEGATTAAQGSSSSSPPVSRTPGQSFVYVFPSKPSAPPKPLLVPQLVPKNTVPEPEPWFDDSYVEQCPPPVAYNRWARKLKNPWWSRVHKPSTLDAITEANEDHDCEREGFGSPQHKRCHSV